jgi:hypothetical protein
MELKHYAQLNPAAMATAAGVTALIAYVFVGIPLGLGMVVTMARGPYEYGPPIGFGIAWPLGIGAIIVAAIAGAIFAWVYNVVNAGLKSEASGTNIHAT